MINTLKHLLQFIEHHPQTMITFRYVLGFFATTFLIWFSGIYSKLIGKKPILEINTIGSFCFVKNHEQSIKIVAFFINAIVLNRSNERIIVRDKFSLSLLTLSYLRLINPFSQKRYLKLYRLTFPTYPRLNKETIEVPQSAWYTEYSGTVEGAKLDLPPTEHGAGYLLFITSLSGDTSHLLKNKTVKLTLKAELTSGKILKSKIQLNIKQDEQEIEKFCPGIYDYIEKNCNNFTEIVNSTLLEAYSLY